MEIKLLREDWFMIAKRLYYSSVAAAMCMITDITWLTSLNDSRYAWLNSEARVHCFCMKDCVIAPN